MKNTKDLHIEGGEASLKKFFEVFERKLQEVAWIRDTQREGNLQKNAIRNRQVFCIVYPEDPKAKIYLAEIENGRFYISNIVPEDKGQLEIEEYNAILDNFYNCVIKEAQEQSGVSVLITSRDSLESIVGIEIAELLRIFSNAANKSTGSSHPCDEERWYKFLIASHESESPLTTSQLRQGLLENGWNDEGIINNLIGDYESSRSLLHFYDKNKSLK